MLLKNNFFFFFCWGGGGDLKKFWSTAFSPFSTVFSKVSFLRVANKDQNCVKELRKPTFKFTKSLNEYKAIKKEWSLNTDPNNRSITDSLILKTSSESKLHVKLKC